MDSFLSSSFGGEVVDWSLGAVVVDLTKMIVKLCTFLFFFIQLRLEDANEIVFYSRLYLFIYLFSKK